MGIQPRSEYHKVKLPTRQQPNIIKEEDRRIGAGIKKREFPEIQVGEKKQKRG